jgi:hypothetical protein
MLVCGFSFQEKVIGVLLIADSPYLRLDAKILRILFTVFEELSSSLLFVSREERMRKTRHAASMGLNEFLDEMSKLYGPTTSAADIFVLNTLPLIEKIKTYGADLDEYRSFQDISAVTATILDGAPLLPVPEKRIILFILGPDGPDPDLTLHQLSLAMRNFFRELRDLPQMDVRRETILREDLDPSLFLKRFAV